MAHAAQKRFFERVQTLYGEAFKNVNVLDCGSLNVNGSLQDLFNGSEYTGVDIAPGPNVDVVSTVHDYAQDNKEVFDTIVSGEMLEHSETWKQDIQDMIDMLKSGGLLAVSCAGKDRAEHGTRRTGNIWGTSPDYYRNLEKEDVLPFADQFSEFDVIENEVDKDLYFYGIKV